MKPICAALAILALTLEGLTTATAQDPLPSWNDTAPKKSIIGFVESKDARFGAYWDHEPGIVTPVRVLAQRDRKAL